ncbi:MAG: hypothetical protein HRT36_05535 [Alphaproteobacteria bacterium]|nr:hypothetical protein [Alphaproteobacteria bacterium]
MQIEPHKLRKILKNYTPHPETHRKPYAPEDIANAIPAAVLVALQRQSDLADTFS